MAGLSVVLVEPRLPPVDKACGEGLMPSAVAELDRLSVTPTGRPFAGIRYLALGRSVTAPFRHGPGLGVRRTVLAEALGERAEELGAVRLQGRVDAIAQDAAGVTAAGVRARWLLAADGLHSAARTTLGLATPLPAPRRYGLRRHFAVRPWSRFVEVHWSPRAEAYVTPVAEDCVGIAVLVGGTGSTYDDVLAEFPALQARLRGAPPATGVRGAGPMRQDATSPICGRVLLVGDAAGYVDALTGEGIAVGLATARAAVAAVLADRPDDYRRAWRRATRRYRWSAGTLVAVGHRPRLRRALVPTAVALPGVFGAVVNFVA
jgi:flavin-dependent dehydrogenase